ncbi:MAG: hypothetical protein KC964_28960 [Candidatus Omnitrophica bacterium]|nr:hypothetical protein [Candidatus Omnitrophota bacterium]
MKTNEFSVAQVMAAARCSRNKVISVADDLKIKRPKIKGARIRYTKDQARKILESIESEKADPRALILGEEAA